MKKTIASKFDGKMWGVMNHNAINDLILKKEKRNGFLVFTFADKSELIPEAVGFYTELKKG